MGDRRAQHPQIAATALPVELANPLLTPTHPSTHLAEAIASTFFPVSQNTTGVGTRHLWSTPKSVISARKNVPVFPVAPLNDISDFMIRVIIFSCNPIWWKWGWEGEEGSSENSY